MNISAKFLEDIEAFIKKTEAHPTNFGVSALNDSKFVFMLRNGRSPSGKTMERVYEYMQNQPKQETTK